MTARKRASGSGRTAGTNGTARHGTTFRKGDRVAWNTSQGETHGVVERKLTSRTHVEGHEVAASRAEPQYLVRSDKSGKTAAHKPDTLRRRS